MNVRDQIRCDEARQKKAIIRENRRYEIALECFMFLITKKGTDYTVGMAATAAVNSANTLLDELEKTGG